MFSPPAWFYWALLSALFASLTAIFAKVGLKGVDSDFAMLIRTFLIAIILTTFVFIAGKWANPLSVPPQTWLFLSLSALATGASWVCYFRALQAGEASKIDPIDKLSVVFVALFATLFLHERPTLRDWLAILLVATGVILLGLKR